MVVRESRSKNTDTVDETLEILHRQPVNELYIGIRARLRHLAGESSKGGKYGGKDGGGRIKKGYGTVITRRYPNGRSAGSVAPLKLCPSLSPLGYAPQTLPPLGYG